MFIKSKAIKIITLSIFACVNFHSYANDEESVKDKTDRLANGLNNYISSTQADLLNAGKELIEEHEDDTRQFIEDYNAYTDNIVEKTSKPISLSGDSDCLANLRLIDIDIIPVDPMDLLRPLKIQLKDLILSSPCEMITNELNDELDNIDFAADSPFGSIGITPNAEDKAADEERKRQAKLQRKARAKEMIFDMGSDFKLKVTERREIVYDEDGSIVHPDDEYEVKTRLSPVKTEQLLNTESLLNMKEVFGAFFPSADDESNEGTDGQQSDADTERQAADDAARAAARENGDN
jgi:hypothetical protein